MSKRLLLPILATIAVACAAWAAPSVRRGALAAMENSFQRTLQASEIEILALPRGVYLEGYGAVFTADVNLVYTQSISPFRLTIGKEEVAAAYQRKLAKMPVLRAAMRQLLVDSGSALESVPQQEQIVVVVTLGNENWETTGGLPSQVYMQGQRSKLMEAKLGKVPAENVIKVQEL